MVIASSLTGGAVLRFAGRVFLGWGEERRPERRYLAARSSAGDGDVRSAAVQEDPQDEDGEGDDELRSSEPRDRTPIAMGATVVALAPGALAVGVVPGLGEAFGGAAERFADRGAYTGAVLRGLSSPPAAVPRVRLTASDYLSGAITVALALALAAAGLWRERLAAALARPGGSPGGRSTACGSPHSGQIGDYVAWFTLGTALLGGALALALAP